MLPVLRSHKEYIRFVDTKTKKVQIPKAHHDVLPKLKLLDLTPLRILFMLLYSPGFGRPSFAPEDMMRTFIAMVLCGVTSPTNWVNGYLKDKSGFYAIISGFLPDRVPSVGCLYDFISRILRLPRFCKGKYIRPKRKKLTRTQKKRLKEDKHKVTKRHVKIVTKLADRFQRIAQNSQEVYIPHAEKIVNDILELCCLDESQSRKLLDKQHLNISADGSKLKTHANPYGKKICPCDSSCDCPRFHNSPDASWGYDAYRNCFIFGYNLYQVNSWSREHKYELPVYLMMATGSRHDSVPGMFAMDRTIQGMGYGVDNGCFDAAHDATDFYRLSRDLWNMRPFIPLNTTNEGNTRNLPVPSINEDGIPICQAGHQMYYSGYCKDRAVVGQAASAQHNLCF